MHNHIIDILQLYEFAMSIGKTLNYKESCDSFLKLLLKRKHLNAAWILEQKDISYITKFSIPSKNQYYQNTNNNFPEFLKEISYCKKLDINDAIKEIAPIKLDSGNIVIFKLKEQGFLFLYSKQSNISDKDISQLEPVIHKFSIHIKACKAFEKQERLLKNLEDKNQELSDYAHMVSHDLKSPLRTIDTLSAWLKEDYTNKLDEVGKDHLNNLRSGVEKMDDLITGILEYSTIGKDKTDVFPVNLNAVLKDVLKMLYVPENIQIEFENLPTVYGDKLRLFQLFQNLISNAIKYNDKEKGLIKIKVLEEKDFWKFEIEDNGKGIEEKYFNKIFKAFEKLENTYDSTGIGLSIVKKIINVYEGNIWLTSQLGKGTTFHFTLKKINYVSSSNSSSKSSTTQFAFSNV